MIAFPNAKINIGLNVVSRRRDGYHNLETVFYPVKINDVLEIVEADETGITLSGSVIPGGSENNLCLKAYELISKDHAVPPVKIHLHKHIPVGAGLGGGSADAAFFIRLLNDKFSIGLEQEAMVKYARSLGADCAFFLQNRPVFAFNRGDEFEPAGVDLSDYYIVLVMPPVQVSTAAAYLGVQPENPARSLKQLISLPPEQWKDDILNDFETSVFKSHPAIRDIKASLYGAGALYASMSGSGSSVYGIFKEKVVLPGLEILNQVFYGV